MVSKFTGVLELDHERGVLYFTPTDGPMAGMTLLRICQLAPRPVVEFPQIDVTVGQPKVSIVSAPITR